ncbi:MAG: CBS domain-containing protein [Rhodocyclaceae bacterium]
MAISVKQVLDQKGSRTFSVSPDTSVFDALALMAEHDIGAVLVIDNDELKGIFTERDYARKLVLKGLTSKTAKVGDMMTTNVQTVAPGEMLGSVMNTMTRRRFRHLPVVEDDRIVGIITIGDVVKAVIEEQEATIQQLSNYIAGDLTT